MSYQSHLLRTISDPPPESGHTIEDELENRLSALEKVLDLKSDGAESDIDEFELDQDLQLGLGPLLGSSSKAAQAASEKNIDWLQQALPNATAYDAALSLLASAASADQISEGLLELFGFERVEMVSEALEKREGVKKELERRNDAIIAANSQLQSQAHSQAPAHPLLTTNTFHQSYTRTPGAQVTIQTATDKRAQKQAHKDNRRATAAARKYQEAVEAAVGVSGVGMGLEEMERLREEALRLAGDAPLWTGGEMQEEEAPNPHIFSSRQGSNNTSWSGAKYSLPEGTIRREHDFFEEVTIPATNKLPMRAGERLLRIDELDEIARGSFPGYETLNRLQSVVYPIAYKTNENMLVCAPTGAGKTDVAMLTILRAINQYGTVLPQGNSQAKHRKLSMTTGDFKVIYVAPMKALAAEIVRKMGKRLGWLGFIVKELTGDMQLTRAEIASTHLIVTTPEKWDVVTRKPMGDEDLVSKVRLLIIDEVHLLHEDRGAVIESIVARTLRQVESSQSLIRIVGLSATLPNYVDVSDFLRVNRYQGLFYFDASFRPVPLEQHFLGVKGKPGSQMSKTNLDEACWEKVSALVKEGHQVMVFVHARKETVKTAQMLREKAQADGILDLFDPSEHPRVDSFKRDVGGSRNKEMKELFQYGLGIHHAGMLRSDRTLSEKLFETGVTKVLCCTATLAWGVNLPAYAVVIKGTQIYDAAKGSFVDLGILDVLQIFGRAGRPQYEDHGVGYIVTSHDKMDHYVSSITQQHPIESKFVDGIVDALNAEIALGTVTTVHEGVQWIGWTYLHVRMRKNPMVYGLTTQDVMDDPHLGSKRHSLIQIAARKLVSVGMITYDEDTSALTPTDLGRIASKYYIRHASIEIFNTTFRAKMTEADVLAMLSSSVEFDQIKVRDSETQELEALMERAPCQVKGGAVTTPGKVNILLQGYISRAYVEDFALVSDTGYVAQNAGRIARALVEIGTSRGWAQTAAVLVEIGKSIESEGFQDIFRRMNADWVFAERLWSFSHPLAQSGLPPDVLFNLDRWAEEAPIEELAQMSAAEAGKLIHLNERLGAMAVKAARQFPKLSITHIIQPLSSDLLRVRLHVRRDFEWSQQAHGSAEPFWIWVEDGTGKDILRLAHIYLRSNVTAFHQDLVIPIKSIPSALGIRVLSDRWVGSDDLTEIPMDGFCLPPVAPASTQLLDLPMLRVADIDDTSLRSMLAAAQTQLKPSETQCFHTISHTPHHALFCTSEPSSSLTVAISTARRSQRISPNGSVLVLSGRRAYARWIGTVFRHAFGTSATVSLLLQPSDPIKVPSNGFHIVIATPKMFLSTATRVAPPSATVLMDLHSLDEEYELAIARHMRLWKDTRFVGLSTSLLDSTDLTKWLGILPEHVYNFAPNVRADALTTSILPFDLPFSAAGAKAMIKPAWSAIRAATGAVLVFVSSRSQCRIVARDLLRESASTMDAVELARSEELLAPYASKFKDTELADALLHSIITLHDGMSPREQRLAVDLFSSGAVKVMVAPREACWTADLRAPTTLVLGTQYTILDDQGNRSISSYDMTELVQMQTFAQTKSPSGLGADFIVMCHQESLDLYSKFLLHGLPLESALQPNSPVLVNELLGAIDKGKILSKGDIVDFLIWTYLSYRIPSNPFYYDIMPDEGSTSDELVSRFSDLLLANLTDRGCVKCQGVALHVTAIGKLAGSKRISLADIDALRLLGLDEVDKAKGVSDENARKAGNSDRASRLKTFYAKLPRYVRDSIAPKTDSDLDFESPSIERRTLLAAFLNRKTPQDEGLEAAQATVVSEVAAERRKAGSKQ